MIGTEETFRSIGSVLRLARFDARVVAGFGRDIGACARSFWAYAFVSPALLLLVLADATAVEGADPAVASLVFGIAAVIELAGFPILLRPLLRSYGRLDRWPWFVTAYNWFNAVQIAFVVGVLGLSAGPLAELGFWPVRAAQVYLLVLEAFLADAILGVGGVRALGVVLLDLFFGLGVDSIARWIVTGSWSL